MHTIYIKDGKNAQSAWQVIHNPMRDLDGLVVINPVLTEALNTHGSLTFDIAPTNPLFYDLTERTTLIKVSSDTKGRKIWFGRIMSFQRSWQNCISVYCEGELGCLCDAIHRPFGFKGSPQLLFQRLIGTYSNSYAAGIIGFPLVAGNVSVTDPNSLIVRSSNEAMNVWERLKDSLFESSLGGYVIPRYDEANDVHYVDYLSLDENDTYAHESTQVVEFGKNLLQFTRTADAQDVLTVLVPYGAEFEDTDPNHEDVPTPASDIQSWNGNRLTVESVNYHNRDYIENSDGIAMFGRVAGSRTWDDVTVSQNLLTKATAWLAQQIWQSVTLEISAVDLSFVDVDIEQIQVGDYVRVKSKPHDLNVLLLCTSKTTALTRLETSGIVLGAGLKTITDLQTAKKEDN